MSFADGKPRIATEAECKFRWGGDAPGRRFRCGLCGHKFKPGDQWRFVFTNDKAGPYNGNPLVCATCDGPDVIDRWQALCDEARSPKFWRFFT